MKEGGEKGGERRERGIGRKERRAKDMGGDGWRPTVTTKRAERGNIKLRYEKSARSSED